MYLSQEDLDHLRKPFRYSLWALLAIWALCVVGIVLAYDSPRTVTFHSPELTPTNVFSYVILVVFFATNIMGRRYISAADNTSEKETEKLKALDEKIWVTKAAVSIAGILSVAATFMLLFDIVAIT